MDQIVLRRPQITKKYERKIRLLVTNACSRNCGFCHNEGMPKSEEIHMSPLELEKILPSLRKYSNRVILSGGEPLEYKYLFNLIELLERFEFDVSINTSLPSKNELFSVIKKISSIHVSIPNILELNDIEQKIFEIHKECRTLQIVLNIPITSVDIIKDSLNRLYEICCKTNARMQFIRIFDVNKRERKDWIFRWKEVICVLKPLELTFLESTNREVSFVTKDLIQIDFLEIPCVASGHEFDFGRCLNDSDISIEPNMNLSICRWTDSSIAIAEKDYDIDSTIFYAFKEGCKNCLFGTINEFLYPEAIKNYMALPHYKWPPDLNAAKEACNILLQNASISYYGKSGYIFQLENEFASYFNLPYAYATASGTVAIYLSCIALGLCSDDEVIIPTYTFPTVVTALISAGVKIRVCDTDSITGNISIESFRRNINKKVKAVVVTHLWGDPVDFSELIEICSNENIKIIEDCSHAYAAEYKNEKVGTLGDVGCFSMQANKAVFSGEGGMIITSNKDIYERIIMFSSSQKRILDCVFDKNYRKFWETGLGLKLKMHPLGAPIALESLHNLYSTNTKRNQRVDIMNEAISNSKVVFAPVCGEPDKKRVYYTYKPLLNNEYINQRDELVKKLILQGLEVTSSSFLPIHKTPLFRNNQIINQNDYFHESDKYYERILSFPAFVNEPIELVRFYSKKLIKELENISRG